MPKVFQVKCMKYDEWCQSVKKNDVLYVRENTPADTFYRICREENDIRYCNIEIRKSYTSKVQAVYLGGE